MDIISHIKDLLYAKRWSREQIIELNASGHRMVSPIVLCINDNPIALVLSFPDNCVNDDMVNYCINELKSQSVKVGFIYSGEYNIFLISILNSREEITHLDDFLTPGETLSLIYYHTYKYTPYLVLLPKLILGTLEFIIAFINCLFSLFNENKQLLRYAHSNFKCN